MPTITVAITYHNEGPLLTECLESLVSETDVPDEILVYDDASTVRPGPFIPAALPVRVLRGDSNIGPSAGRNVLLRETRSEYIHFHDSDDLFLAGWCEAARSLLNRDRPDALFHECSYYDWDQLIHERVMGLRRLLEGEDIVRFCIRNCILVPGGVYRTEIIRSVGGYNESVWLSEDFEFHLRLARAGVRYTVLDTPLVHVRARPESRSRNLVGRWSDVLKALEAVFPSLPREYMGDLAERAAQVGAVLYKLGARDRAKDGFELAQKAGKPTYAGQPWPYKVVAQRLGPLTAERATHVYRRAFPHPLRRAIRGRSA